MRNILTVAMLACILTVNNTFAENSKSKQKRPFLMGFSPWPYDFTTLAVKDTYRAVEQFSDIIAHHLDEGVPWTEALYGKPYHPNVENNIQFRIKNTPRTFRVYLAMTPVSGDRKGLAGYWAKNTSMKLPAPWKNRAFDDKTVILAYTNFCRNLIKRFRPDYFAYGIEANILARHNPEAFEKFIILARSVYHTLKKENPDLPIFLTLGLDDYLIDKKNQKRAIKKLLPYSDYIALSSYPFSHQADPYKLPENLFSELRGLAPSKPFAIAETGFIAEDLSMPKYHILIRGNEERQKRYVRFLLNEASRLDARFVIWFVIRDYDPGWVKLKKYGVDELFKMWRDTGLLDERGRERKALKLWSKWLKYPVSVTKSTN